MATYYSRAVSKSKTALVKEGSWPARYMREGGVWATTVTFAATTAVALDDVVQMVPVQAGTTILDVILTSEDIDSGAGLVMDVGDGTVTDRFIDGATVGQAGGVARLNEAGGHGFTYTADDTIDVHIQVGPIGDGVGSFTLTVIMSAEPAISG